MKQPIKTLQKVLATACCLSMLAAPAFAAEAPLSKPEAGTFKMGIEPWLGYGQWHVANNLDLFKQQGLDKVDIINFAEDKDINAALASGRSMPPISPPIPPWAWFPPVCRSKSCCCSIKAKPPTR